MSGARVRRTGPDVGRLIRAKRIGGVALLVGGIVAALALLILTGLAGGSARPTSLLAAAASDAGRLVAIVGLAGASIAAIGVVTYVVAPGFDPTLARRDWDHPRTIVAAAAAAFILANVVTLPYFLLVRRAGAERAVEVGSTAGTLSSAQLVVAVLATQACLIGVLIWRVVRPGLLSWEDIGLDGDALGRRLGQGVVGGLLLIAFVAIAVRLLQAAGIQQTQSQMFSSVRSASPGQFIGFWLGAAVVAPICEEAFFRGYAFGALRAGYGRPIAYGGSAVLFAVMHLNPPAIVPIVIVALGLAFLYDRSRSVVPGIVAHGINNGLAIIALYLAPESVLPT